ncbi:kelch repeat-containing protein [Maricaulis sp.]|uniref:Kelch repeat-containing protein n=1 Tax=Maricaulis sp. TaxID=1486257 RepID=UPI00260A18AA|nr:kelch repeat-containing protein [Maricaulis sp.]
MRNLSLMLAVTAGLASTAMLASVPAAHGWVEGQWGSAARLDAPRAGLAVAVLDGRLYAAGGSGVTTPRVEFDSYDAEIDRWFPETPLPRGLERFGMAAADGRIYVAGGYAQGGLVQGEAWSGDVLSGRQSVREQAVAPSARMWSWSPEGGVWQSEAAMPAAKADFDLVTLDDRLYAIGGQRDDNQIFVFDPQTRNWETLESPVGVTRSAAATIVFDGRIYVIGGFAGGEPLSRVDVFDPQSASWSAATALPDARGGLAVAHDSERIHVFGGRGTDNTTLDLHASWAPGEGRWRTDTSLPSPRTNAAAAALQGALYVIGGGSGGGFFSPFTAIDNTDIFRDEAS